MRVRAVRWPVTIAAASVIALAAAAAPSPGRAALPWTLTASPLAVGTGAPTTFTLTATNLDPLTGIRCIVVSVPASFTVDSAARSGTAGGKSWLITRAGNVVSVAAAVAGTTLASQESNPVVHHPRHRARPGRRSRGPRQPIRALIVAAPRSRSACHRRSSSPGRP